MKIMKKLRKMMKFKLLKKKSSSIKKEIILMLQMMKRRKKMIKMVMKINLNNSYKMKMIEKNVYILAFYIKIKFIKN